MPFASWHVLPFLRPLHARCPSQTFTTPSRSGVPSRGMRKGRARCSGAPSARSESKQGARDCSACLLQLCSAFTGQAWTATGRLQSSLAGPLHEPETGLRLVLMVQLCGLYRTSKLTRKLSRRLSAVRKYYCLGAVAMNLPAIERDGEHDLLVACPWGRRLRH